MNNFIKLLIICTFSFFIKNNMASDSLPISIDPRIRTLHYEPNQVYPLSGLHGYHTTVQLNEDEVIQSIDLGDAAAWNVNASGSGVTLKPIADIADTNMTIRTNKRLYLFQLTAPSLQRDENGVPIFIKSKDALFLLRFVYPKTTINLGDPRPAISSGVVNPLSKVHNRFYTARGDDSLLPRAIYDDGKFTYLDYTGIQPLPNIYAVDKKRSESLVNKRMEDEWIVIEGTFRQYTLRHGNQVSSIFNDMTIRK